ncbi:hypothetical protein BJX99DRAFT_238874 [Aspergillus californicus]
MATPALPCIGISIIGLLLLLNIPLSYIAFLITTLHGWVFSGVASYPEQGRLLGSVQAGVVVIPFYSFALAFLSPSPVTYFSRV